MNSKRNGLIILGVFLLILVVGGVTYAFFSYSRIGEENTIVTGSLYLNFEQENQIVLDTLFPENEVTARSHNDNVIEFTINGYTETIDQDIIYGIMLEDGDSQDGKTRIDSESIRFDLDETVGGVTRRLIDSAKYEDYRDGYIYVDRVLGRKSSTEKGIGEPFTRIGNEEIRLGSVITSLTLKDTITEDMIEECIGFMEDMYPSEVDSESFCQGTGALDGGTIYEMADNSPTWYGFDEMPSYIESREYKYYKLKDTITQDMIDECSDIGKSWDWDDGETAEAYCSGTGTGGGSTLQMDFVSDVGWFSSTFPNYVEEVPSSQVYMKEARLKTTITEEMVDSCKELFIGLPEGAFGPDEPIDDFCRGTGVVGGETIDSLYETSPDDFIGMFPDYVEWLTPSKTYTESEEIERTYKLRIWIDDGITISDTDESADYRTDEWPNLYASIKIRVDGDFLEKEQMEPINEYTDASCFIYRNIFGVSIAGYDTTCGSDISIPPTVLYSAQDPNCNPKLSDCATLPPVEQNVIGIDAYAFESANIKNVTIPSSVEYIDIDAFYGNPLENVTIKGSPVIGTDAFVPSEMMNGYDYTRDFKTFSYGGTCSLLDTDHGGRIFSNRFPNRIITSDTNNCILTEADIK